MDSIAKNYGVRPGISDTMRRIVSMLPTPPLASTFCASFAISSARHLCPVIARTTDAGQGRDAIGSLTSRALNLSRRGWSQIRT